MWLKEGEKRRKQEEEDVSSYRRTLKKIRFWDVKEEALPSSLDYSL